jgi:ParB-like chromosome segregation protein Spo0J
MTATQNEQVQRIPIEAIEAERLTEFGLDPAPLELEASIRAIGITHPLALGRHGPAYRIACGHRRHRAALALGHRSVPAYVVEALTDADRLMLNLQENRAHRHYTDIEKGRILSKLHDAGIKESELVTLVLPLLGEEKNRKRAVDLLNVRVFEDSFQRLLHALNIPLRVFAVMGKWEDADRAAAERLFADLRPGRNKLRDLLEMVDEIAVRDATVPRTVLEEKKIRTALDDPNRPLNERYDAVHKHLHALRNPYLSDLQSRVRKAAERLNLDPRTKLRLPDNFEQDLVKIELRFSTQEELTRQVEKLFGACDADALAELMRIIKEQGGPDR